MLVSRLEIFGFKSFLEKLSLPLTAGLTAVVGPNGCGKSNVVDALRWILGETKASSLRGDSLEDVIFNGTETLRPLGLAEVSITIRSEKNNLLDEIIEQQQSLWGKEREPEEQEIENAVAGIAAIIPEDAITLADTLPDSPAGSSADTEGRPKLSVIQGMKGTEASQASKVQASEHEGDLSERELEGGQSHAAEPTFVETQDKNKEIPDALKRFSWLAGVSELQVTRRLYRSGESEFFLNKVACRLRDIKEVFRVVGVAARGYTVVAQGEVTRLITSKPVERRVILEEAAGISGFREKRSAAERRLEETATSISRIEDIIKEVSRQVSSLRTAANRAKNRAQLKQDLESAELRILLDAQARIGSTVAEAKAKEEELRNQDATLSDQLEVLTRDEEALRLKDNDLEQELQTLRHALDEVHNKLSNFVKHKGALESRRTSAASALSGIEREQQRTLERTTELEARFTESSSEFTQLKAKEEELRKELGSLSTFDAQELRSAEVVLKERRVELTRKEADLRQTRERMIGLQSKRKVLEEQIEALSPRKSLADIQKRFGSVKQQSPWVGELEQILTQGSLPVIAELFSTDRQYARALEVALGERATALVTPQFQELSTLYARLAETPLAKECSSLESFTNSVETKQNTANAYEGVTTLLSVVKVSQGYESLAGSLLSDIALAANSAQAKVLLDTHQTLRAVATETGELFERGHAVVRREGASIVSVKNALEGVVAECELLEGQVATLQNERNQIVQLVSQAEEAHSEALRKSQERQRKVRELSSEHGVILGKLHIAQRMRSQLESDLRNIAQQQSALVAQFEQRRKDLDEAERELSLIPAEGEAKLEQEVREMKELTGELEQSASESRTLLRTKVNELHRVRTSVDAVRRELSNSSLALQRATIELEGRREQFVREYPDTIIPEEKVVLEPAVALELKEEAQKLRSRLIREGDVDPTAPERLEIEEQRLRELETQKSDLVDAATTLRDTIAELCETSKERFEKLFVSVSKNFSRLVEQLFGGGAGELTMSDPSNPLESGIELYVRPPGKKPKSIDLLSGGEKALCALALMIALFLERPSPLCVLDEVDAPLDEANLQRFVGLIKEMSKHTQFVMVTHNKQTMSVADRLIGVTMPQAGASKVLMVSLDEAFQAVA